MADFERASGIEIVLRFWLISGKALRDNFGFSASWSRVEV